MLKAGREARQQRALEGVLDYILRTGQDRLLGFAFLSFSLHGMEYFWDIGQKTGYASARTWRENYYYGC